MKEQDGAPAGNEHLVASRAPSDQDYITPEGFTSLRQRLTRLTDADARASIERRLAAAIVVEPPDDRSIVAFGATVVTNGGNGRRTYRIVGSEEIDVARNAVGLHSPLAVALIGARAGDVITWHRPAGDQRLTVESVAYPKTRSETRASHSVGRSDEA